MFMFSFQLKIHFRPDSFKFNQAEVKPPENFQLMVTNESKSEREIMTFDNYDLITILQIFVQLHHQVSTTVVRLGIWKWRKQCLELSSKKNNIYKLVGR